MFLRDMNSSKFLFFFLRGSCKVGSLNFQRAKTSKNIPIRIRVAHTLHGQWLAKEAVCSVLTIEKHKKQLIPVTINIFRSSFHFKAPV